MKQIIPVMAVAVTKFDAPAQTYVKHQSANYGAAAWNTMFLDPRRQIKTAALPTAAQSKAELQTIKKSMCPLDEDALSEIKYRDADAPAYRWNLIIHGLVARKRGLLLPMPAAWLNLAIYGATIVAWKERLRYKRARPQDLDPSVKPVVSAPLSYSYPCDHTVTATAAATVRAHFFAEKKDSILGMAHVASKLCIHAGIQFPGDVEADSKSGEHLAKEVIEKAKSDGSTKVYNRVINKDSKKWTGAFPMGINMLLFSPMVLRLADQFSAPAPPDFKNDMKKRKNFKQTSNSKYPACFWTNNADIFNDLANKKLFEYRMVGNALALSRLYTVLSSACHDMAIAVFNAKYTYRESRPVQYDSTYKSFITPLFPGYPSGHAAGAGTASAVLEHFFPVDASLFRQLARACADSKFYEGIHFRTNNETALSIGRVLENILLKPG